MKSTRPDGIRHRLPPRAALLALLFALGPLAGAAAELPAPPSSPASPPQSPADACAAARDRALAALDAEAISVANALDADAALADAPSYELEKAAEAVLAGIEQDRQAAEARYRRCLDQASTR